MKFSRIMRQNYTLLFLLTICVLLVNIRLASADEQLTPTASQVEFIPTAEYVLSPTPSKDENEVAINSDQNTKGKQEALDLIDELSDTFIEINKNKTVTIRVKNFSEEFQENELPLEVVVLPEKCSETFDEVKKHVLHLDCDQTVNFTITSDGTYDFNVLKDSQIVIFQCIHKDNSCDKHPEDLKIKFISNKLFKKNDVSKKYSILDLVDTKVLED
ncbi:hypothetical protein HYV31_03615 [candidate division WWE3 bacterium]|nr:hypothetical protein [candidate division WWE3 bacterium]